MVGVGVFALVLVALVMFSRLQYFRYLVWVMRDRPAAMRKGCRVCGGEAVRATWHARSKRQLWPFGPTTTVAWCQTHYNEARARKHASSPTSAP